MPLGSNLAGSISQNDTTQQVAMPSHDMKAVNLFCKVANYVQYLKVGDQLLVKFITICSKGFFKEKVTLEESTNDIFTLTTQPWESKGKWILHTHITAHIMTF